MSDSSRIAKNTIFLYFRMFCVMGVGLYTVRVVLAALGINGFGIYQTIGGIIGLLGFLNGALSTGSSRFLTFELGRGVTERLRQTFSTLLLTHIILAGLTVLVAEVSGIWYIYTYLNIMAEQLPTALVVFQFTVLTAVVNMTQIPYTAIIIAHEQLKVYAYMSLVEVFFKLGIAWFIAFVPAYRLEWYAGLLCLAQVSIVLSYRVYCYRHYEESRFSRRYLDWSILKSVGAFSGWSTFAGLAIALMNQGVLLMLNTFFSPAVVSARVIAMQVNNAAQQFLNNFRTAADPQIVKRYASGDYEGSQRLLLTSTRFSFYLMLVLAIPIVLLAEPLLSAWLHEVPDYAVLFLQWSMVQSLFAVFDSSLYTALYAKGQLRENALTSPMLGFVNVAVMFGALRMGCSPLIISYCFVVFYAILGLVIKPVLLCKVVAYRPRALVQMFSKCGLVATIAIPVCYLLTMNLARNTVLGFLGTCVICVLVTASSAWYFGMQESERKLVAQMVGTRIKR